MCPSGASGGNPLHVSVGKLIRFARGTQGHRRTPFGANGPYSGQAPKVPRGDKFEMVVPHPSMIQVGSLVNSPSPQGTGCGGQDRGARPEPSVVPAIGVEDRVMHNISKRSCRQVVFSGWMPGMKQEGRTPEKLRQIDPASPPSGFRRPLSQHSAGQLDTEGLGIPGSADAITLPHSGQLRGGILSFDGRPVGSAYPIKPPSDSLRPPGSFKRVSSQRPMVIKQPPPQGYGVYMKDKSDEEVQMKDLEGKLGKDRQAQRKNKKVVKVTEECEMEANIH